MKGAIRQNIIDVIIIELLYNLCKTIEEAICKQNHELIYTLSPETD